jgi:hypothetical protein
MYVTEHGDVWASTEQGWCWLREDYYEHGWTWESGYDAPLAPVSSLLDLLGNCDVSAAVADALRAVRGFVDAELAERSGTTAPLLTVETEEGGWVNAVSRAGVRWRIRRWPIRFVEQEDGQ